MLRKIVLAILAAIASSPLAFATPYFRPVDFSNPQVTLEGLFDVKNINNTSAASFLNVVTHSQKDGCLLKAINVCEDWAPLQLGGVFTGPNKLFGLGPQINLLPFVGLQNEIQLPYGITMDMSVGAKWLVAPDQNWKGYFRVSAGPTLKF